MAMKFRARQKMLGMSECEQLCGRWSRDVEELAFQAGWRGMPGERVSVPVGTALNMLVLSIAMNNGVEVAAMGRWLPGLREEALLKLGEDISNWAFEGASEVWQQFRPTLYGTSDTIRSRVAPLLECYSSVTTRQLRFYSLGDVECLSKLQFEEGHARRTPRFVIDAHALADTVQTTSGVPLFQVSRVILP